MSVLTKTCAIYLGENVNIFRCTYRPRLHFLISAPTPSQYRGIQLSSSNRANRLGHFPRLRSFTCRSSPVKPPTLTRDATTSEIDILECDYVGDTERSFVWLANELSMDNVSCYRSFLSYNNVTQYKLYIFLHLDPQMCFNEPQKNKKNICPLFGSE